MPVDSTNAARPLRADAERNRQRILEAAERTFAQHGTGVTMDDVAAAAGVGVGTVYRRFADKDELIDALFDKTVDRCVAIAEAALAQDDPWDGVVYLITGLSRAHAFDHALRNIRFTSGDAYQWATRARRRMEPLVTALVERAQAAGDLRPDVGPTDLPLIEMMLAGINDLPVDRDLVRGRIEGLILDGLRTRRDEPTPLPGKPLEPVEFSHVMADTKER